MSAAENPLRAPYTGGRGRRGSPPYQPLAPAGAGSGDRGAPAGSTGGPPAAVARRHRLCHELARSGDAALRFPDATTFEARCRGGDPPGRPAYRGRTGLCYAVSGGRGPECREGGWSCPAPLLSSVYVGCGDTPYDRCLEAEAAAEARRGPAAVPATAPGPGPGPGPGVAQGLDPLAPPRPRPRTGTRPPAAGGGTPAENVRQEVETGGGASAPTAAP